MLPSNNKSYKSGIYFDYKNITKYHTTDKYCRQQNLYIITDDELKLGDHVISIDMLERGVDIYNHVLAESDYICKKIIATTDTKLQVGVTKESPDGIKYKHSPIYLPSISNAFIKQYINSDGVDEVNVVYIVHKENVMNTEYIYETHSVKVNSQNEIIIHSIKNSWTRKEVIEITKKVSNLYGVVDYNKLTKWIEENL